MAPAAAAPKEGLVEAFVAHYLQAIAVNSNTTHRILREKHNPSQTQAVKNLSADSIVQRVLAHGSVSYTHLRAHET